MIIGVTGTNGAGKGTVVEYLVREKGFAHYSVREFLLQEIRERGLPEDRNSMREVANEIRKNYHPAHVIETLHSRALDTGEKAVIESIRTIGEAEFLKAVGAFIIAVDADKQFRYERISSRGSMTDRVSLEDFTHQEDVEMTSSEPWAQNVFGVMTIADARIENNGTLEELHQKLEEALTRFG